MPMTKIIQCNLNKCWGAQDLFLHQMKEMDVSLCAISEPARILKSPRWFASRDRMAAICWSPKKGIRACSLICRGERAVAVKCDRLNVISCYVSPNKPYEEFLALLDELECMIRRIGSNIVVCGDFNAHSIMWGSSRTSVRGERVEEWAAGLDLRLLNDGTAPTCVRPQGTSIIDLTWITSDATRWAAAVEWKVLNDTETLSDHKYVSIEIGRANTKRRRGALSGMCHDKVRSRYIRCLVDLGMRESTTGRDSC